MTLSSLGRSVVGWVRDIMTRLPGNLNRQGMRVLGREPTSRVISFFLGIQPEVDSAFVISEHLASGVRIREIHMWAAWVVAPVNDFVVFQFTHGPNQEATLAQVQDVWTEIMPVRWTGGKGLYIMRNELIHWDWHMNWPLPSGSQRIAAWVTRSGTKEVGMVCSILIEE